MKDNELEQLTILFAEEISNHGGRVFYVGGRNRDLLMGYDIKDIKDIDLEVFNVSVEVLEEILNTLGSVNFVGKSYGVYKLKGHGSKGSEVIDISIPKTEISTGKKHTDVIYETNPFMSYKAACTRRDLRMNSILIDVLTGEVIDPLNGKKDIEQKLIHATNWRVFITDPLRVLRAIQFSSRFGFKIGFTTRILCRLSNISHLPKERVFEEFNKILLKSEKPSVAFENMKKLGLLKNFPLLKKLTQTPQSRKHHKEGNAWNHTMLVIDEAAKIKTQSKDPLVFMWAALLHDIGKVTTTKFDLKKMKFTSYDHQTAGEDLALNFLKTLTTETRFLEKVSSLVGHHMQPLFLNKTEKVSPSVFRRLSCKVDLQELHLLSLCDRLGRKGIDTNKEKESAECFRRKCEEANCFNQKPKPLVLGRDILALNIGIVPGPKVGELVGKAFELQLEGYSKSEILEIIKG